MVLRPQWEWQFTDDEGAVRDRPLSPAFTTRYDAEEWLGAQWRAFAEQGVRTAQLLDDGSLVPPALDLLAARAAGAQPAHPARAAVPATSPPAASDHDA